MVVVCRYMSISTAIDQLLEVEAMRKEGAYSKDTLCVGLARLGADDQQMVAGPMEELREVDFGAPLHSFIIAGMRGVRRSSGIVCARSELYVGFVVQIPTLRPFHRTHKGGQNMTALGGEGALSVSRTC
jgi:hypothetical protein